MDTTLTFTEIRGASASNQTKGAEEGFGVTLLPLLPKIMNPEVKSREKKPTNLVDAIILEAKTADAGNQYSFVESPPTMSPGASLYLDGLNI